MIELWSERYRAAPLLKRAAWVTAIAFSYPTVLFVEEYEQLNYAVEQGTTELQSVDVNVEAARQKIRKLAELEANLDATKAQLEVAKRALPDEFPMQALVASIASYVAELNLKLNSLAPGNTLLQGTSFPFVSQGISVVVEGSFDQLMAFLDHMPQLEYLVNIDRFTLAPVGGGAASASLDQETEGGAATLQNSLGAERLAQADQALVRQRDLELKVREELKVRAIVTLSVYRSLTAGEEAKIETAAQRSVPSTAARKKP